MVTSTFVCRAYLILLPFCDMLDISRVVLVYLNKYMSKKWYFEEFLLEDNTKLFGPFV